MMNIRQMKAKRRVFITRKSLRPELSRMVVGLTCFMFILLQNRFVEEPGADLVGREHQRQADYGGKHTHGDRVSQVTGEYPFTEHVGLQYVCHVVDGGVVHDQHLLEYQKHMAEVEQQHRYDGRADARNRYMPQPSPVAGPVDGGSLVELRLHRRQACHIDDRTVAHLTPDVGADQDRAEELRTCHEVDRFSSQFGDDVVHQAGGRGEQAYENTAYHNPAEEVGDVDEKLDEPLGLHTFQLIDHQGDDERGREVEDDVRQADNQRIAERIPENRRREQALEVFQSHKRNL